jgi:hypothetical protein
MAFIASPQILALARRLMELRKLNQGMRFRWRARNTVDVTSSSPATMY